MSRLTGTGLDDLKAAAADWRGALADPRVRTVERLLELRDDRAALAECQALVTEQPSRAELHDLHARAALAHGQGRQALGAIDRAVACDPTKAAYERRRGRVLLALGDFARAESAFRAALALDGTDSSALHGLATIRSVDRDEVLGRILAVLRRRRLSRRDRSVLSFAAARCLDDLGVHDEAFAQLETGNGLAGRSFDLDAHRDRCSAMIETFDPKLLRRRVERRGEDDFRPIFIIGLPRSGTSLVEQILASHPSVHGAGESPLVGAIAHRMGLHDERARSRATHALSSVDLERQASTYRRAIRSSDAAAVTDKALGHYLHVGLLAMLFTKAVFVHCRRHALDTLLSCYFQRFRSNDWTFDLETLGAYYLEYQRLMEHWSRVLPGRLVELDYEDLVTQGPTRLRPVLEAAGLAWHPACADFASSTRLVKTMSQWQVRQPLYSGGIGRWRDYRSHLRPLRKALGELCYDPVVPSRGDPS